MKKLLFLFILMLSPMLASADAIEIDGIYYNLNSDAQTAEVTRNPNNYDGDVVIPSSVNHEGVDYRVTGIGVRAFYMSSNLTSVSIPNSMTTIGRDAFRGCNNLTKVEINNNAIVSKDNPSSSPTPITSFFGTQVEEYVLGEDVTSIGSYAFYNCNNLTSVQMSNNITTIGEGAFQFCNNLASVKMSDNITNIGQSAFYQCFSLASITIPKGVTNIEPWTFVGCGLKKVALNSNAIMSKEYRIGNSLSSYFGYLVEEYVLGEDVTSIGDNAFSGCSNLSSINIPDNVTSIGEYAFSGCSNLSSINIPDNVASIGENAFYECIGLTTIQVESGNTIYDSRDNCNAIIKTADNTLLFGCQNTVIPNSVTAIGDNAFYCCTGLTAISIPNGVTSIGNSVFCGCSGLTSVNIPNSVISIEQYAFASCKGLTSIIIPNSVKTIGEAAFFSCSSLSSITIPSSVTSIAYRAFQNCSGLTAIQVESGNTVYDSRENCNAIIETTSNTIVWGCMNTIIPNSVTSIGKIAFSGCSGLTSITIPNSVTTIESNAFWECTNLTSISLPNSVTYIGSAAFADCWNLATVIIGDVLTNIGDGAFIRCSRLKNMYCYTEQVPELGNNVFDSSHYNATLHVPEGSLEAYNTTEQWMDFGIIVALTDSDPIPTGIKGINDDLMTGESYYSIDGKQMATPQRGLNIIRMNDGTTKKIVIK